jgi:hypothetical protein
VDMKKTKPSQMITGNQRLTTSAAVLGAPVIPRNIGCAPALGNLPFLSFQFESLQ